jgi:hypothetical protein
MLVGDLAADSAASNELQDKWIIDQDVLWHVWPNISVRRQCRNLLLGSFSHFINANNLTRKKIVSPSMLDQCELDDEWTFYNDDLVKYRAAYSPTRICKL